jgi:hypothetical protein
MITNNVNAILPDRKKDTFGYIRGANFMKSANSSRSSLIKVKAESLSRKRRKQTFG